MAKTLGTWVPAYATSDFERALRGNVSSQGGTRAKAVAVDGDTVWVQQGHFKGYQVVKLGKAEGYDYSIPAHSIVMTSNNDVRRPATSGVGDIIRKVLVQAADYVVGSMAVDSSPYQHTPFKKKVNVRGREIVYVTTRTHRGQLARLKQQVVQKATAEVALQFARQMVELQSKVDVLITNHIDEPVPPTSGVETSNAPTGLLDLEQTLSAKEFGDRAGISDETVRTRERQLKVFSFLAPARTRGREYPLFQLHPKIYGAPLEHVLDLLRAGDGAFLGGADAYQFFVSPNPRLAMLTPAQLLAGVSTHESSAADALASKSDAERLAITKSAAVTFAAIADA